MNPNDLTSRLMKRYYPGFRIDPLDAAFSDCAKDGMAVLDAGCGGARGCAREAHWKKMYITGADADPAVMHNPFCDKKVVCDLSELPFEKESFDLIHCRWVLEHLENPLKVFREFARVLRPGGRLLVLTPNAFHYSTIISRVTPHWFHQWWLKGQGDPFKTYYRANSAGKLRRLCTESGFEVSQLKQIEGLPHYFLRNAGGFMCGVVYERIVNSTDLFRGVRQKIFLNAVLKNGSNK